MEFPKYICNKDSDYTNALVLIGSKDNKATYWRHGGCYRANAQYEDGRLMVYETSCLHFIDIIVFFA